MWNGIRIIQQWEMVFVVGWMAQMAYRITGCGNSHLLIHCPIRINSISIYSLCSRRAQCASFKTLWYSRKLLVYCCDYWSIHLTSMFVYILLTTYSNTCVNCQILSWMEWNLHCERTSVSSCRLYEMRFHWVQL